MTRRTQRRARRKHRLGTGSPRIGELAARACREGRQPRVLHGRHSVPAGSRQQVGDPFCFRSSDICLTSSTASATDSCQAWSSSPVQSDVRNGRTRRMRNSCFLLCTSRSPVCASRTFLSGCACSVNSPLPDARGRTMRNVPPFGAVSSTGSTWNSKALIIAAL